MSASTERRPRSRSGSAPSSHPASRFPWDPAIHRRTGGRRRPRCAGPCSSRPAWPSAPESGQPRPGRPGRGRPGPSRCRAPTGRRSRTEQPRGPEELPGRSQSRATVMAQRDGDEVSSPGPPARMPDRHQEPCAASRRSGGDGGRRGCQARRANCVAHSCRAAAADGARTWVLPATRGRCRWIAHLGQDVGHVHVHDLDLAEQFAAIATLLGLVGVHAIAVGCLHGRRESGRRRIADSGMEAMPAAVPARHAQNTGSWRGEGQMRGVLGRIWLSAPPPGGTCTRPGRGARGQ